MLVQYRSECYCEHLVDGEEDEYGDTCEEECGKSEGETYRIPTSVVGRWLFRCREHLYEALESEHKRDERIARAVRE